MEYKNSRRLKIGDRVCWGGDTSDAGTVVDVGYLGVAIKWDHVESAGVGPEGVGTISHDDMGEIELCEGIEGMRERPIIFSGRMVRAILEGRKTQTRRVVTRTCLTGQGKGYVDGSCPYGRPGDRLWLRETWFKHEDDPVVFRADLNSEQLKEEKAVRRRASEFAKEYPWKSPIFMPRALSRITLELTDIRVERLQEISRDDLIAEGVHADGNPYRPRRTDGMRAEFVEGWDLLNTKRGRSWASNPWVWVLTFRKD